MLKEGGKREGTSIIEVIFEIKTPGWANNYNIQINFEYLGRLRLIRLYVFR